MPQMSPMMWNLISLFNLIMMYTLMTSLYFFK
nr:ATP synthase F0 subunit 8 [Tropilaelaps mercedesae]WMV02014.1 ATP synthase F0 subunit 8 [Tropilaelaps mercedesae]